MGFEGLGSRFPIHTIADFAFGLWALLPKPDIPEGFLPYTAELPPKAPTTRFLDPPQALN